MDKTTTLAERIRLAAYVREQNLAEVNAACKPIKEKRTIYTVFVKRLLDICLSAVALVVLFPVNLILGICTYFDVGRPIFFLQERPGKYGKLFTIVKFRNMRNAWDENGLPLPIAQRVTKFGSFVRRTSLDELLNFWSILKGDMSLIGPRPLAPAYLQRYNDYHMCRHLVRPGLECPNLKNKGYSRDWNERLDNDVWYAENVSFVVDVKMVLCLFRMVFDRKTRKEHAVRGSGDLIGYEKSGRAFGTYDIPDEYILWLREGEGKAEA